MAMIRDSGCSLLIGQTIMLFYIILVIPAIIITLRGQICNAEATICNHNFNYTKGSEFESNLNTVFNRLVQNTSQTGFNTSVYGQSPNQIYGLLNCRGDATADQCYNCSQRAIAAIRRSDGCGNGVGGAIWMDLCFLRYENFTFSGKLSSNTGLYTSITTTASEPQVFNAAVSKLLSNLSSKAESESRLYASGTIKDSLSRKIYGLVQCWRDISSDDCTTCLSNTINYIFVTLAGNPGVNGLMENCFIRYEIYPFFNSTAFPPSPSPAEGPVPANTPVIDTGRNQTRSSSNNSSNKLPIILGVAGGLLLVLLVCMFAIGRRLKSAIIGRPSKDKGEEDALISEDPQIVFTMQTLVAATGNFHDDNKLGEGGFGPVYKGITPDGKEIAVKKLSLKSQQGKKEFMNEVRLVTKIQHRNLVNILGCCAEGSERLLVYEYLPKKSLDKILFDPNKRNQLDWHKRYNIVRGVARGLAKLFRSDETHISTGVAGTYGYMAPEYAMQGQLTVKADVYSFGILLLELIAGRKNTDYNLPSEMQILLGWAWKSYKRGNIMQMIDPAIIETWDEEQALRCFQVGILCTQADPSLRPPMSTVNLMLSSHSVTLPDPTEPAFVNGLVSQSHITSSGSGFGLSHASESASSPVSSHAPMAALPSNADASITVLVPR